MLDDKELRKLSKELIAEPDNYIRSFRRNVSLYIDQKDITLQEVADLADISISTLKSFLYGNSKDCNLSMAVRLARVFGVSVDELIGAGTIHPQACNSLQTLRQLPESFTHFVRWCIKYHYDNISCKNFSERAVEVMNVDISNEGNMVLSNQLQIMDISELSNEIRPKAYLGIRIPNDMYAPIFFEGDILLLANDRRPKNKEKIIFPTSDNLWVLERCEEEKEVVYKSIRDGKIMAKEKDIDNILGYIVKVYKAN